MGSDAASPLEATQSDYTRPSRSYYTGLLSVFSLDLIRMGNSHLMEPIYICIRKERPEPSYLTLRE